MRRPAVVAALSVAALAAGALVPRATADPAEPEPLTYVALGDSYSAASGVLPLDPQAPLPCLRSSRNYPHVIAGAVGAELVDVTCGAAETKDFFESQHRGVAPQLDAIGRDTDVVTMTIGGNDSGVFINAILQCGMLGIASLGLGSPCRDAHGSSFEDTINEVTFPSLVNALRAVKRKAPDADIAILGYPWIMPESGGCFPVMPVARGDVPYLRSLQGTLNDAVQRAARRTGVTYIDFTETSDGHDACQAIGIRWIEPAVLTTNPVIVHPNALGEAEMAAQTIAELGLN